MSKLERIKAEIALREKLLFAAIATVVALVGWMAEHYASKDRWLLALSLAALVLGSVFVVRCYRTLKKLIEELENE